MCDIQSMIPSEVQNLKRDLLKSQHAFWDIEWQYQWQYKLKLQYYKLTSYQQP